MKKTVPNQESEESVRAAWYQAHKDDADFLQEFEVIPVPARARGRPSRNMGARISVRFTPEEMAGIRAKSVAEGISYSEVVRRAVNTECLKTSE